MRTWTSKTIAEVIRELDQVSSDLVTIQNIDHIKQNVMWCADVLTDLLADKTKS